ncbi:hypothetical protein [Streptomyces sp. NPDC055287]
MPKTLTDDRWSQQDWQRAAMRALTALGHEFSHGPRRDRTMLIGCLRQGLRLRLARDFSLELDWLTPRQLSSTSATPCGSPSPHPPATTKPPTLHTPAEALVETLSALARRMSSVGRVSQGVVGLP